MSLRPPPFSLHQARAMLLAAQGVEPGPRKSPTRAGVLAAIRTMGQLQIDTISVVNRSPYLVLHSRIGDYQTVWLEQLLEQGKIFENWSHEACFLPIEDYRYAAAEFPNQKAWRKHYRAFVEMHRERADELVELIRTNGPVRSADFEQNSPRSGGWWSERKHEKLLLEGLFADGTVMVVRRENFQRVYGLREIVLPDWSEEQAATLDEADDYRVAKSVAALGVTTERWVADYYRMPVARASKALARLIDTGVIHETEIDTLGKAYLHESNLNLARKVTTGKLTPKRTVLLSPFDPIVWHRLRASQLFGFDYRLECYTPAEKRVYGYFTLPILHRGRLVGRLDPKAHRALGVFEVKALHLEPGFEPDDCFVQDMTATLEEFAVWHRTPEMRITATHPACLRGRLIRALG